MKKCPYCGHIAKDTDTHCEKCYAYIPETKPEERKENEPEQVTVTRKRTRS